MDDLRVGAMLRAIRIRRRLRQSDLARFAGVSQSTVSRVERGAVSQVTVAALRSIAGRLEVRLELLARWRGGDLDRLVNARHARLAEVVTAALRGLGWEPRPEVSFAVWGERGVIDVMAWHAGQRTVLVIELKTEIADIGELLGTLDRKRRLAGRVASDLGWGPVRIGTCLLVADGRRNRRRIGAHRATFEAALPDDGRRFRAWLRNPTGSIAAVCFWTDNHPGTPGPRLATPRRVSGRRPPSGQGLASTG